MSLLLIALESRPTYWVWYKNTIHHELHVFLRITSHYSYRKLCDIRSTYVFLRILRIYITEYSPKFSWQCCSVSFINVAQQTLLFGSFFSKRIVLYVLLHWCDSYFEWKIDTAWNNPKTVLYVGLIQLVHKVVYGISKEVSWCIRYCLRISIRQATPRK